jgi:hypothetical protein
MTSTSGTATSKVPSSMCSGVLGVAATSPGARAPRARSVNLLRASRTRAAALILWAAGPVGLVAATAVRRADRLEWALLDRAVRRAAVAPARTAGVAASAQVAEARRVGARVLAEARGRHRTKWRVDALTVSDRGPAVLTVAASTRRVRAAHDGAPQLLPDGRVGIARRELVSWSSVC